GPQDLTIDALVARAHEAQVSEIILALNATVDGQTTAHYITDLLQEANVKVTRLAHGVPVGGELDYLDEGTLSAALRQRALFYPHNGPDRHDELTIRQTAGLCGHHGGGVCRAFRRRSAGARGRACAAEGRQADQGRRRAVGGTQRHEDSWRQEGR